ncbi:MAG: methionine synthase [Acidimicrobiales bacterium]|nr:methionine synthase [Acidimicrobiales bacterium]
MSAKTDYIELINNRVVVFDGALGTNLQLKGLTAEDFGGSEFEGCNEILVDTRPEVVKDVHNSFLDVGVDVIETNSFGSFSIVLNEYSLAHRARELSFKSAKLAREAADSYSTPDRYRFVAGSIGPGTKFPTLGQIPFDDLVVSYEEQALGLIEGGVDLLLVETVFDLLQAKAAIVACRKALKEMGRELPIQVQVTIELTGRMLPGTEIGAALNALEAMRPDVIGLNCATGPAEMIEPIRYLTSHTNIPISCLPNAGLPSVVDGKMHYDLTPDQLGQYHKDFVENFGVSVVGGCCGTTPLHLQKVVEAITNSKKATPVVDYEPGVSSLYSAVTLHQESSVLVIGERTNANGSKKFREAMLEKDWDTTVAMARDQIAEGAHCIDVCVDYTGANGVADMAEVMSRFATAAPATIGIDSTEPPVIETALKWLGGKAILNSVNLEEGDAPGTRLDRFLKLAKTYGAAVICTCIDTDGQARTREWKFKAAKAIHDLAVFRYGLSPQDLIFDPLALPLSTGMEESRLDGIETIEGIRMIKEGLPGVHTVLGLSNVSFGLNPAARQVLNSVYLHECAQAGLDAAIVHAGKILPLHRIDDETKQVCLDLIYDRRREDPDGPYDPLQRLLALFEGASAVTSEKEDLSSLPVEQRLERRIIDGNRNGLVADLEEALGNGLQALEIVNDILLKGMKTVGELFASGEMQLPFVLASAETMKTSVNYLEPFMEKAEASEKGSIVLATVAGDVHDIGKNLVDIILTNNGYVVHNLGIKVSISEMLEALERTKADAIGMSGLLVKSTLIMRDNLDELKRRNLDQIPVILGGAALTRTYVEHDLRTNFSGRVFYGKDAFEGLRTMDRLMEMKRSGQDDPEFGREIKQKSSTPRKSEILAAIDPSTIPAISPVVERDNTVFKPPFIGSRIAKGIPIDEIASYLNETSLFRNQWGHRPNKGEADTDFKDRIRQILRAELTKAKSQGILIPQVAWGYFPVESVGNDLIIYEDESKSNEIAKFTFPRQKEEPYLCIADFFRSRESGESDYCAFQLVTMGREVSLEAARLFKEDKYSEYVKLHGLGVEMAEALAELWHLRIRQEWGFANEDGPTLTGLFRQKYRGGRYSFGYPACPRLEDNETVVNLLEGGRIGVEVSEGFQLHPEQTTLAIVCHHPKSKYFIA